MSSKPNNQFLPALTGFRAIAAWMIFVYHFFPFQNENYPQISKTIVDGFHIGVDLFFVLSGFLISYRYFDKIKINFGQYMVNRFSRIYPMFFIITTLAYLNSLFIRQDTYTNLGTELFLNYTLTKALFFEYHLTGVKQAWTWTLTLEEMFYLMAPFLFILVRKKTVWLLITLLVILVVGTTLHETLKKVEGTGGFLHQNIFIYFMEFFGGVALSLLLKRIKTNTNFIFTLTGSSMILVFLFTHRMLDGFQLGSTTEHLLKVLFLTVFGVMPLYWGLINEKNWVTKILSTKLFVLLGQSSYIFYLIHKGFISIYINDYIWENKLFLFIGLNLISIVLFIYVEDPLNNYLRSKFKRMKDEKYGTKEA